MVHLLAEVTQAISVVNHTCRRDLSPLVPLLQNCNSGATPSENPSGGCSQGVGAAQTASYKPECMADVSIL